MKHRHDLPLSLLAAMEDESLEGRTRLQKLLFLIQKRAEASNEESLENHYNFVAYDYGPFAKEVYDDVEKLVHRGLVEQEPNELDDGVIKYNYRLTGKGHELVDKRNLLDDTPSELDQVVSEFSGTELSEIIDFVYSQYPQYAKNSEIR